MGANLEELRRRIDGYSSVCRTYLRRDDDNMNIGIVTTWFERGAAYVSRQYRDLLSTEHEVFIYARGGESYAIGDPHWDDARVTWAKKCFNPLLTAVDLQDFERWIRSNKLDVVFFNEQHW